MLTTVVGDPELANISKSACAGVRQPWRRRRCRPCSRPRSGCWVTPFTMAGWGSRAASRIVGTMSMTWWNCERISAGLDALRPGHDHRVACAAEVAGHLLAPLERRVHRPGPAHRVQVGRLPGAEIGQAGMGSTDRSTGGGAVGGCCGLAWSAFPGIEFVFMGCFSLSTI